MPAQPQLQVPPPKTDEDMFRDTFAQAAVVLRKLAPLCRDVNELAEMLEMAANGNDGCLNLLVDKLGPLQLKR